MSIAQQADEAFARKGYALAVVCYQRALVLYNVGCAEEAMAQMGAAAKQGPGHPRSSVMLGRVS